jgi:hypothetical protein
MELLQFYYSCCLSTLNQKGGVCSEKVNECNGDITPTTLSVLAAGYRDTWPNRPSKMNVTPPAVSDVLDNHFGTGVVVRFQYQGPLMSQPDATKAVPSSTNQTRSKNGKS